MRVLYRKVRGQLSYLNRKEVRPWLIIAFFGVAILVLGVKYANASYQNEKAARTLEAVNSRIIQLEKTLQEQNEAQQKRDQEIESKLQSRLIVRARLASIEPTRSRPSELLGTHIDWTRAAGIADSNFTYVDYIVRNESGWNPNSVNQSSGACSLAQALPCSKISGDWTNPVNALQWMNSYVLGRYGSWYGAYLFWQSHNWY